jgi:hypothetical protein
VRVFFPQREVVVVGALSEENADEGSAQPLRGAGSGEIPSVFGAVYKATSEERQGKKDGMRTEYRGGRRKRGKGATGPPGQLLHDRWDSTRCEKLSNGEIDTW